MGVFGIILLLVALLGLYGIFHVSIYNKLQNYQIKLNHVEGIIDNELRNKFDQIIRADDAINNKLKNKKEYLKEYLALKDKKISNFELERKLNEAESIIHNLYNDNEQLIDNENILEIIEEIKVANQHLNATINYYNKYTTKLNAYIKKFPNNMIAKIHHFKVKPFFDGKDMTDNDIEDFKL